MTQTDAALAAQQLLAGLSGPGGQWELEPAEILGVEVPVFKNRFRSLHEMLASSQQWGDSPYVVSLDGTLTYAEHLARVSSLARALREEHGIGKGDRVAIASANNVGWIQAFWATVSIGAIAVGYNAWWSPRELAYGLEHATPKLIFADGKRQAAYASLGVTVPVLDIEADLDRMATAHPDAPPPSEDVAEDDPAVILYTSGTSGRPKGAVHSHRNVAAVVEYHRYSDALAAAFGDPTDPRQKTYLLAMPLFHVGSLHNLIAPRLATGSKVALHLGAFDVAKVLELVEKAHVTHWGAVPTMANRLLAFDRVGDYDTSSLYAFSLASAPSSVEFKQRLREGLPFASALVDSYGMTETCTAICVATPIDLAEAPGSLGRPIIGVEMQVRDVNGRVLPPGEEGEVHTRSCFTMLGYWNNPEATAAAFTEDRWLRTGDLGTLDEQGRLRLSSRRSDLIIRGGENVYPAEVEGVLAEHPSVAECVVLGVPHSDLGQEVGAVVVAQGADDPGALELELRRHAAENLAHYKVPTHWKIVDSPLPRNATGKVIRTAVSLAP
ncbi:class I adenylate-forming enzyme family protein [Nocardioides daejeonensis]|uniref:class I adenylate-forming enzyme family protein n=1 Tax=Nocardioides daejeonensis TaxID=1046556 RepID=UPI000D7425F0|nr:class I adenylate-forming enzyme family protein [Nocardioides daejeonensis]